jgi:hypothetical protein
VQRYLISFDDGAMDHLTEADLAAASVESHAAVRDARAAGVWIFGGGLQRQRAALVGVDGSVTDGPEPGTKAAVGGFAVLEVASREDALHWAGRIAAGCRCTQEVREIMFDPES